MLSLLSSSDNYLRLTQTAHACIVLNTSCKKIGARIRRMCYRNVIIGLSFMHVPFWGILVSKINDLPFSGGAIGANGGRGMSLFEQTIFLENKNVHFRDIKRPKTAQNGPNLQNYLRACPFLRHCHFGNKCFTVLRTCNIMCVFHNMHACTNP